ncbi:hypothetical protein PIB19_12435 [Sphingomonas sp. 7/4-4]|uniref:hypothetical protein n=1 Tax=Sphingomonas sp. 7/4-4 TaxID=3018446 RepID=UPI0022F38A75|nr:hypothetical protein [Sphingomonas sp. 7/4-4]WBY06408.1 hypothetical protein PIB19_12435 [Sphingomonas sp. 7/4-4]
MQGGFGGSAERSNATARDLARIVAALEPSDLGLARQADPVEGAAAAMLQDLREWRLAYQQQRRLELPA